MQTYDKAEVMFGGVAIGTAYNLNLAEPVPIKVIRPEPPPPFTVTAECRLADTDRFFADVQRLMPTAPSGVVTLSLPWGILGTIKVPAAIAGAGPAETTEDGRARMTMNGTMDEREMRRVIANAVRRVIVNEYARDHAVVRALEARSPAFGRMAHRMGFSRPGGCYRGERKQRKAMRRLLRAAGITRPAT